MDMKPARGIRRRTHYRTLVSYQRTIRDLELLDLRNRITERRFCVYTILLLLVFGFIGILLIVCSYWGPPQGDVVAHGATTVQSTAIDHSPRFTHIAVFALVAAEIRLIGLLRELLAHGKGKLFHDLDTPHDD